MTRDTLIDCIAMAMEAWTKNPQGVPASQMAGTFVELVEEVTVEPLVSTLADLFGWQDRSYLHALLHVGNAVSNLRADLKVLETERDHLLDERAM